MKVLEAKATDISDSCTTAYQSSLSKPYSYPIIWCAEYAYIDNIDNVDNYGKTNNTNATPIACIKIFYQIKENVCVLFVFSKSIVMYFTCHYSRCSLMLEQLYIDMNMCQPVSVQQTHTIINSSIQSVLPFTKSVENTRKHRSFVTFNIGFPPHSFPLFCKISVKGWAAELKVKRRLRNLEGFWEGNTPCIQVASPMNMA